MPNVKSKLEQLVKFQVAMIEIRTKLIELEDIENSIEALLLSEPKNKIEFYNTNGKAVEDESIPLEMEIIHERLETWCNRLASSLSFYLHPTIGRYVSRYEFRQNKPNTYKALRMLAGKFRMVTKQIVDETFDHAKHIITSTLQDSPKALSEAKRQNLQVTLEGLISTSPDEWLIRPSKSTDFSIFIIHGHDEDARLELISLLEMNYNVQIVIMKSSTHPSLTIPEIFEKCVEDCNLAIALLTPDDVGAKVGEDSFSARARQNVLIELGWFWGRFGRDHMLMLSRGHVEMPSDLSGLKLVKFAKKVEETRLDIDGFMRYHGVEILDGNE